MSGIVRIFAVNLKTKKKNVFIKPNGQRELAHFGMARNLFSATLSKSPLDFSSSSFGLTKTFNINDGLSKLLIDGLLKCGQIDKSTGLIFDYDNQFIATEKYNSRYSYNKAFGYFPGIAQIQFFTTLFLTPFRNYWKTL